MSNNSNNEDSSQELSYQHKNLNRVSLILLTGLLIKKNAKALEEILIEVMSLEDIKWVVIDYSKLNEIGKVDRDLVQFQIALRDKGIHIRHCGLPSSTSRNFLSVGTLKEKELKDSLTEAIKEITNFRAPKIERDKEEGGKKG